MATDKRITELQAASGVLGTDIGVLVNGGITEQFQYNLLLALVMAQPGIGSAVTFGVDVPVNSSGKNSDVFFRTSTNVVYQRLAGVWTVVYSLPNTVQDGTVLYGNGIPGGGTGKDGDTYINVLTGVFYARASGIWSQVFSMATGPAGPRGNSVLNGTVDPVGSDGQNGDFWLNTTTETIFGPKGVSGWGSGTPLHGTNGNTIISGTANPTNDQGANGDYYINTSSYYFFGPKAAGVWPSGFSLVASGASAVYYTIPAGSDIPKNIPIFSAYPQFGVDVKFIVQQKISAGIYKDVWDCGIQRNYNSGLTQLNSIDFTGHSDFNDPPKTTDEIRLTIYA